VDGLCIKSLKLYCISTTPHLKASLGLGLACKNYAFPRTAKTKIRSGPKTFLQPLFVEPVLHRVACGSVDFLGDGGLQDRVHLQAEDLDITDAMRRRGCIKIETLNLMIDVE